MTTLTCLPDDYLSEAHLATLFNEFQASLRAGQADGAVFSSLVNNVRHIYMAALLKDRSDELARVRRELAEEREPLPEYRAATTDTVGSSDTEAPVTTHGGGEAVPAPSAGLVQPLTEEISWPAKTFTLHIGSYSADHRRDMPGWGGMDRDGWVERLYFQAFKYEEPDTIRVEVTDQQNPHRMMVKRNNTEWKPRLTFYAYGQPRPGTQYIWVAFRADPDRCIFLKGKPADRLEGWERILEFWVPK